MMACCIEWNSLEHPAVCPYTYISSFTNGWMFSFPLVYEISTFLGLFIVFSALSYALFHMRFLICIFNLFKDEETDGWSYVSRMNTS